MSVTRHVGVLGLSLALFGGATTTASAAKPGSAEASACALPIASDRLACRSSYTGCSVTARTTVRSYYNGHTADLSTVALRYGKRVYGSAGFTWQAGMTGCYAALQDEYNRLYR